jgi:hypothetical protein
VCNQTPGGECVVGRGVSQETRQLISKANKGVKRSDEALVNYKRSANDPTIKAKRTAGLRRAIVELKNDPVRHAALCARNKDVANRPSTQEKRRLKMVGQKRTPEQRENMARAQQKRGPATPIARANMIAAQNRPEVIEKKRKHRGKRWKLSEEQCRAKSIRQTGVKRSEEAKMNMKKAQGTPEARKRKRETQLGRKKT